MSAAAMSRASNQAESWSSYLSRAAQKVIPAAIAGFSVGLDPVGAAVSSAVAFTLFFLEHHNDNLELKLAKHVGYMFIPAAAACGLHGVPDYPSKYISRPVQPTCLGVDITSAVGTYLSFNLATAVSRSNSQLKKYVVAAGASLAYVTYIKTLEIAHTLDNNLCYDLSRTPYFLEFDIEGSCDFNDSDIVTAQP